jgi:hypothetical protein
MPSYLQIIQVKGQRMTVARDEQDEGVLERGVGRMRLVLSSTP